MQCSLIRCLRYSSNSSSGACKIDFISFLHYNWVVITFSYWHSDALRCYGIYQTVLTMSLCKKMKEIRTRRTPNALATPARVTSECKGPTPPYINTSKKHQAHVICQFSPWFYDDLFNGLTISQIDLWRSTSSDTESIWLKKHSEALTEIINNLYILWLMQRRQWVKISLTSFRRTEVCCTDQPTEVSFLQRDSPNWSSTVPDLSYGTYKWVGRSSLHLLVVNNQPETL